MYDFLGPILNLIGVNVGVNDDTADANGSLHAKIAYYADRGPIKSIQRGTISMGSSTSVTATISEVNTSKAVIIPLGVQAYSVSHENMTYNTLYVYTYTISHALIGLALTDSTTVTASRLDASGPATVGFEIVEYY